MTIQPLKVATMTVGVLRCGQKGSTVRIGIGLCTGKEGKSSHECPVTNWVSISYLHIFQNELFHFEKNKSWTPNMRYFVASIYLKSTVLVKSR